MSSSRTLVDLSISLNCKYERTIIVFLNEKNDVYSCKDSNSHMSLM